MEAYTALGLDAKMNTLFPDAYMAMCKNPRCFAGIGMHKGICTISILSKVGPRKGARALHGCLARAPGLTAHVVPCHVLSTGH